MNKVKTFPHQGACSFNPLLGFKVTNIKQGNYSTYVVGDLYPPTAPTCRYKAGGGHGGYFQFSLRLLSMMTLKLNLNRDYGSHCRKVILHGCVLKQLSQLPNSSAGIFWDMWKQKLICLLPQPAVARAQHRLNGFLQLLKSKVSAAPLTLFSLKEAFPPTKTSTFSSNILLVLYLCPVLLPPVEFGLESTC